MRKNYTYATLFEALYLTENLISQKLKRNYPLQIPNDVSCETTSDDILKRICTSYGLYFGSIKARSLYEKGT